MRAKFCSNTAKSSAQFIPILGIDMRLTQDAMQSAYREVALSRHNGCVDRLIEPPYKLDVTALLADFDEPSCLKAPFDFAEGLRFKPPQPLPRSCEPWVGV